MPQDNTIRQALSSYLLDTTLVRRIETGDILVPTFNGKTPAKAEIVGFQRVCAWPRLKADRFIESLLGLPVPGIFLVKEPSGVLLVLDGYQRLYAIHSYCSGAIGGREYRLSHVQDRFLRKRYRDLDIEDRRRLDESIIHATIVRQDEPTPDQSGIYVIFERLNTAGVSLQPQEIRMALYHGEFVRVLEELNSHPAWRKLYGNRSKRLKDMELILRFFAFLYNGGNYQRPMALFLNRYMAANRQLERQPENELRKIFTKTTDTILNAFGNEAFRPRRAVNAAVVDSVMTGVAKRIHAKGTIKNLPEALKHFTRLMADDKYLEAVESGTSQEANVETRLSLAQAAFAQLT
jgi:hypothetical protein